MASGNQRADQIERGLGDRRGVEEFDHQRQIDTEAKHIRGVHLAACAKPGDAAEHDDALHAMLVVQDGHDLLQQVLVFALLTFAEVDANHHYLVVHARSRYRLRAM